MKFNKLVPELSVSDLKITKKFYVDVLGFKIEYQRVEDKFLFLSYQGSQMMAQEINNNWSVGELEKPFGRGINFQMLFRDTVKSVSMTKCHGWVRLKFHSLLISVQIDSSNNRILKSL